MWLTCLCFRKHVGNHDFYFKDSLKSLEPSAEVLGVIKFKRKRKKNVVQPTIATSTLIFQYLCDSGALLSSLCHTCAVLQSMSRRRCIASRK